MIVGLRGTIEDIGQDFVVMEVGGISYKILAPTTTLSRLQVTGRDVKLFTHLHVREDVLALFGFISNTERESFETLIGVGGIGPKAALNILSSLTPGELALAISEGNIDLLTRIPGIGKKTAGRLILELKGKIDVTQVEGYMLTGRTVNADVIGALAGLGYSTVEIGTALGYISEHTSLPVEEQIRLALQHFANAR